MEEGCEAKLDGKQSRVLVRAGFDMGQSLRFRFQGIVGGSMHLSRACASPDGPIDRCMLPPQRLPSINRKRFFRLLLQGLRAKAAIQLDRGPPSHGRKGETS